MSCQLIRIYQATRNIIQNDMSLSEFFFKPYYSMKVFVIHVPLLASPTTGKVFSIPFNAWYFLDLFTSIYYAIHSSDRQYQYFFHYFCANQGKLHDSILETSQLMVLTDQHLPRYINIINIDNAETGDSRSGLSRLFSK